MIEEIESVDVIIPVFNGGDTIQAAIKSVLNQQGKLIHKISVVDDGSTDDSIQKVLDLKCSLIQIIRSENQGVAKARNLGIETSQARWIAFIDADDVWMPDKLVTQITIAEQNNVEFVCGSVSAQSKLESCFISPWKLASGNFVATSSVLVRRKILERIRPVFSPKMTFAEDYLAWWKCLTVASGYYVSKKMVSYILSERPRYQWFQIFHNMIILNVEYIKFTQQIQLNVFMQLALSCGVFLGCSLSLLSIAKRFISSAGILIKK
jgi:glycosyltransferase involved in cell wall biosynthesis